MRRAAFLSGGEPLDVFADALFGAETPEEERRLVSERHAMSTELTGVLGNELERAGIKVARDLASADLAAFGASSDLVRRVEVLLRFLAPGSAVGRPKGLPDPLRERHPVSLGHALDLAVLAVLDEHLHPFHIIDEYI